MLQLPFDIPESLVSYAKHFERDTHRATQRLEKQLDKRGPDAVGYMLLSWFLYRQDKHERAVDMALKAHTFAPGSTFIQNFHYYLSHPDLFDAWTPKARVNSASVRHEQSGPILNLDRLIEKLSKADAQKMEPDFSAAKEEDTSINIDTDAEGIYSETLAKIYEDQGKFDTAIHSYKQLKARKPDKDEYFNQQVERLENMLDQAVSSS